MKKIRSIIAVALSALVCGTMAFTVTACKNNNTIDVTTTGDLKKDENGNVIFDGVTIKLATVVAGDDKAAFEDLVARFNIKYDGKIYVESDSTSQGLYETQIANRISNNNNPPDLLMSHGKYHKNFADKNLIQSLNETMDLSGITIDFSQYSSGLSQYKNLGATDGSIYSVPADAQSVVVVYNKKIMNELGVEVPSTRAELLNVCAKFKEKYTSAPIAWADNDTTCNFSEYTFATAILQNGGTLVNSAGKVDWFDDKDNLTAVKNAIAAYRELYDLGYASRNYGYSLGLNEFMQGKRLFFCTAPWFLKGLIKNYAAKEGVSEDKLIEEYVGGTSLSGWFAMGENAGKSHGNYIYGDSHCFAMSARVTDINKKAAILEFIKWFTQTGSVAAKWAEAGHITSCTATIQSNEYKENKYASNYISKFYPDINGFNCLPVTTIAQTVVSNLNSLFAGTVTVAGGYTDASDEAAIKNRQDAINNATDFFS